VFAPCEDYHLDFFCFFAILWLLVLLGLPLLFDLGTLEIGQLSENGVFWYSPQMAISGMPIQQWSYWETKLIQGFD
jgi:hypothetical protein